MAEELPLPDPAQAGTFCYNNIQHTRLVTGDGKGSGATPGKPRDAQGCRKLILSLGVSSILHHVCKYELEDIKIQKWPQLLPTLRSQRGSQAEQVLEPRHQHGQD